MNRLSRAPARLPLLVQLCAAQPLQAAAGSDDLQFFQEEAAVVTASRRLEPISDAPAAVEVITAEEIRDSGAVNLWDFMRYRAGMTVLDARSGEGNRAIVSIRGFPAEFVNNVLVLIDGRSVYTGLSGGAVWEELPVQVQDIERIEIVRGPSAALYGSNAGLGVINIISRKPAARRVLSGEALVGNGGLHREQAAFEDGAAPGAYRLSFAHKAQDGYPISPGSLGADYLFSNKGSLRGVWHPGERATVELFSGGSWDDVGVLDPGNPAGRFRHDFQMLKGSHELGDGSSIQAMAARRDDVRTYSQASGGLLTVRELQYDAELSHHLDWLSGTMRTIYGGSFRYTGIDSNQLFAGNPYQKNAIQRGFASQSWRVSRELNVVGAVSLEHSDTGGTQPAYQLAVIAKPCPNHAFRLSYGLAPTIPTLYDKAAHQQAASTLLLAGNPAIGPQKLRSYEAGYQGSSADKRALWEANLFYMNVDHLSETIVRSYVFPLLTLSFDDANAANARGAELKFSYRFGAGRSAYANYTYETISDEKGNINVRRGTPPHKLNLGGTAALTGGFSLSLNAGYQDAHTLHAQDLNRTADIPAYWRLDGRLGYRASSRVEIFVACQNMAQSRHVEFAEGLVVPRTYQAGLSVKFAP